MGIISEVNSSYTVNQIKKGLNKSANDNDITINTNVDNIIDNIDQFEFQTGSVESFLNDENSFTSESLVDNLITYVKEKGLNVDISKLVEYNNFRKEIDKNEEKIFDLLYNSNDEVDTSKELEKLYDRNNKLYKYLELLTQETLNIKQKIKSL
jgi:thymidine kinase